MTTSQHPIEDPARPPSGIGRLPSPTYLWFLGLLALPAIFFDRLVALEPFVLFFLFGLWPLVAGIVPGLGREASEDPVEWIDLGGSAYERRATVSSILLLLQPVLLLASVRQMFGMLVVAARYRGRLPDPVRFETSVSYRLPFDGEWTVVNGSPDRRHSHSWTVFAQRYAYDFVITDDAGRTHDGGGGGPSRHYCFGKPILAPANGVVVALRNDHRDHRRTDGWLDPLQRDPRGNYVTLRHAPDEYSVLAHLQRGSVTVEQGQRVRMGEPIGRCGNSGNSTEPHLHFQLQDGPDFFTSMGLPVRFDGVATRFLDSNEEYGERAYVHAGQVVRHTPGSTTPGRA